MDTKQMEYKERLQLLGLNVAYYRKRKNLTQEQLAEIVQVDRSLIGKLETGTSGVLLETLFLIADALEIEAYKLLVFRD